MDFVIYNLYMFRLLFGLISIIVAAVAFWFFSPPEWKEKGVEFLTENELVPEPIREAAQNVFHTPAEQRAKLIAELEKQLTELKNDTAAGSIEPAKIQSFIEESEKLVGKLKNKNEDGSTLLKTATNKIAAEIKELGGVQESQNDCPQPK